MSFTIYPAIDLKDGQAVRLTQGRFDEATVYNADPVEAARRWLAAGAQYLHVVDLDGALHGDSRNREALRRVLAAAGQVPVQLGGGMRHLAAIEATLALGVARVIIGTGALEGDLVEQACSRFGPERVAVGIDARGGLVATRGWTTVTAVRAADLSYRVQQAGVRTVIYTDIARDGMLAGPNFDEMAAMAATGASVIASGGIAALTDLSRLREIPGVSGAIVGKAIYTGRLDLRQALLESQQ
jgi:phosphoribosylformimino-5-aminoimidazole carboxamide ribotide isomerase